MAEKLVLLGTPGTPTGSLPNVKHLQGTPMFQNSLTVASSLCSLLSVPGHFAVGIRLLTLGMENTQLLKMCPTSSGTVYTLIPWCTTGI